MLADAAQFDALWDYQQPAATETLFRELLSAVAADAPLRAELLTQIARAQGLQRRFDDAHATLDEVERGLPDLPIRPAVRYRLERGRVYNSSGDLQRARAFFEEAWRLAAAEPGESFFAVDAAHMMAIASSEQALAWNRRALEIAQASSDLRTRNWSGSLLNNMGWAYHELGDYPAALLHLEQALAFRREQGQAREIRIARWCVARVRRDLGQVPAALEEQRDLLAEYESLGERSGYVYEEIGECLLALGDRAAALPFLGLAYEELSADPWLVANEPARLQRLRDLSSG